jgi:hypothetical protein
VPEVGNPTVESTSITVEPDVSSDITLVFGCVTKFPYTEPSKIISLS